MCDSLSQNLGNPTSCQRFSIEFMASRFGRCRKWWLSNRERNSRNGTAFPHNEQRKTVLRPGKGTYSPAYYFYLPSVPSWAVLWNWDEDIGTAHGAIWYGTPAVSRRGPRPGWNLFGKWKMPKKKRGTASDPGKPPPMVRYLPRPEESALDEGWQRNWRISKAGALQDGHPKEKTMDLDSFFAVLIR